MNGIIIYKGKYGATAQYAQWLGQDLNMPVLSSGNSEQANLNEYDLLMIGTSVYIGKMQIAPWLRNNIAFIRNKKIILFVVAGTPPNEKEKLDSYVKPGLPDEIRQNCEVYYLHGKLRVNELSWKDRFLLKIGAWLVKDPQESKKDDH